MTSYIINGDISNERLLLAHGAGAPMDSNFMNTIAHGVAQHAIQVIRFEFPYMQQRRLTDKKSLPDRQPILLEYWQHVISQWGNHNTLFIGGKSLGARIASLIAAQQAVRGLVCLGYPFHPARKPETLRTEHLPSIRSPTLIVQGERDALGNSAQVARYDLPPDVNLRWMIDADHDLKPRVKSGYNHQQHLETAIKHIVDFIHSH